MMYLLDTNACLDFLDARSLAVAKRIEANVGALAISTITAAELLVGPKTSEDPKGDARKLDAFIASVHVVPFDLETARVYGNIIREIGVERTSFDRLIGVHAVALGFTLVTRNRKHFADVPGLRIENWAVPA